MIKIYLLIVWHSSLNEMINKWMLLWMLSVGQTLKHSASQSIRASFTLAWHIKWQIVVIKIYRSVKCKIDAENELKEAYLASSVQAWRFVICRSPWLFFLPHFTHLSSLLFPPSLASMSSSSLSKIEEGGWAENRAIHGGRATERVSLETAWTQGADERQRQGWKNFDIKTNRVSLWQTC